MRRRSKGGAIRGRSREEKLDDCIVTKRFTKDNLMKKLRFRKYSVQFATGGKQLYVLEFLPSKTLSFL